MKATRRTFRSVTAMLCLVLASIATAQYALDSNLAVGAGRRNPGPAKPAAQRDIYTVNRSTGEMQYNRANAFNDPVYTTYQRYTLDRFEYFEPGATQPMRTTTATAGNVTRHASPSQYQPTPGFSKPSRRSNAGDPSISSRQYRPAAQPVSSGMATPTYRVKPTRAR